MRAWLRELCTCRDDAERGRLLDISRRLRGAERRGSVLLLVAAAIGAPSFGWVAALPAIPGIALFWVLQRRLDSFRHPERLLLICVVLTQSGLAAGMAIAHGPRIYLLPLFMLLALLGSLVFPVRTAAALVAYTTLLMLAVALGFELEAVRRLPFALLYPLAIMIAGSGIAMVVAGLDVSTRGSAIADPLTGLPNRMALRARVAELEYQSRATGRPVAVIVGDPDRFKAINDTRGHAVGDAVLREVAARLREALGGSASAYRLGGEEFVALIAGADAASGAAAAERARRTVSARAIEGLRVEISFGVAASEPGERFEFGEVFGHADRALYEAKSAGGNRVRLWPLGDASASTAERRGGAPASASANGQGDESGTTSIGFAAFEREGRREGAEPAVGAVTAGEADVADRWAWWNAKEHAATGNWLVADDLQRRQLLELNRHLRERAKFAFGIVFAVAGLASFQYGWELLIAPTVMTNIYIITEHNIERFRRPEYALGLSWVGLQLSFLISGLMASHQIIFGAPLVMILLIGSSAVFPPRGVIVGTALTVGIMIVIAFAEAWSLFLRVPGILAYDVAIAIVIAMLGAAVARSTIHYRDLAVVDELTGLFNRTALVTRVAELTHRAALAQAPVAVIVVDVDRFKAINDTHGHGTGDIVLKEIGYVVRQNLRAFESAYRVGGEEFVVLLDGVDWQHAEGVALRLRAAVADRPIAGVPVTVSVGLAATAPGEAFDYEALFKRADGALYEAKRAGGNRLCADRRSLERSSRHGGGPGVGGGEMPAVAFAAIEG